MRRYSTADHAYCCRTERQLAEDQCALLPRFDEVAAFLAAARTALGVALRRRTDPLSIADISVTFKVALCYNFAAVPLMFRMGYDEPLWLAVLPLTYWLGHRMARPYLPHFAGMLRPGAPQGLAVQIVVGSFLAGLLVTALGIEVVTLLFGDQFASWRPQIG